jgi:predicted nucleic acid-binding protein
MKHVFVETNWVFQYCAPVHRSTPESRRLVERAALGELSLYVPAVSLREGCDSIRRKCQPTALKELQDFRRWALANARISAETDAQARTFIAAYANSVQAELDTLDTRIDAIKFLTGVEVFALDQRMLDRAIQLRAEVATLKPFDEAILAAILVKAGDLTKLGATELFFCELDGDLLPFDRTGQPRKVLADLYRQSGIAVRRDFEVP